MTRKLKLTEAAAFLLEHDGYILITHIRPDGDTLGSAVALAHGLRRLGKTAYLAPNSQTSPRYLPWVQDWFAPAGFVPETVLSVDTASLGMFPPENGQYKDRVKLAIDHHDSHEGFGELTLLRPEAAACGELVYDLLRTLGLPQDRTEADFLYIALSTDTGCFSYGNTTADTFRIAGLCAAAGADIAGINKIFFRTKTPRRIAVEGEILHGMRYFSGGKIALVQLSRETIAAIGADEDDLDSIAAIPVSVEGVVVGVTLRELETGEIKVSVRSGEQADCSAVCRLFGGGGHKMAAGCTLTDISLEEAAEKLVSAVQTTQGL